MATGSAANVVTDCRPMAGTICLAISGFQLKPLASQRTPERTPGVSFVEHPDPVGGPNSQETLLRGPGYFLSFRSQRARYGTRPSSSWDAGPAGWETHTACIRGLRKPTRRAP